MKTEKFDLPKFLKMVAFIAVPVAMQNLLTTTGSMVDTMMVAKVGDNCVGAIGLCAQFSSLMLSGYWGLLGGGILFISQYWGARDEEGVERSFGITLMCMLVVGMIFGSLAVFAPEFVMRLYTDKEPIQKIGVEYLKIVGFAYPLQVFSQALSSMLRSTEKPQIPLFGAIAAVVSNIFFNWVLIFGNLGAPAMGVRGAATATVIASLINIFVVYLLSMLCGYKYLFTFKNHFKWTKKTVGEYFIKCFPIICNEVLVGVGNMIINITLGHQSEEAINAIAVLRTLEGLIIGFFAGFSSAASVLVGSGVGAGETKEAYERAKRVVYLCQISTAVVCIILIAVHYPLLTALGLSGESYRIGCGFLYIFSVAGVIRMGNWVQNDTYRSAGDAVFGTVCEIVFMYAMVIPCVVLSNKIPGVSVLVVFACCYIDEPIRYVLMQIHTYSGKWIKPVTDVGKAGLERWKASLEEKKKAGTEA